MKTLLLVWIGGGFGAALRYCISIVGNGNFPFGTLLVNVLGAFAAGYISARIPEGNALRTVLVPGFLGGFTTYSAFAVESVSLLGSARIIPAVLYVVATLTIGLMACAAGYRLGT